MTKRFAVPAVLMFAAACASPDAGPTGVLPGAATASSAVLPDGAMPEGARVYMARGIARASASPFARNVNMTNHGGPILTSSTTRAIFWGTTWTSSDPKIGGLDSWYQGYGGSNYAKTNTEYTASNGTVGATSTYLGSTIDNAAAPSSAPATSAVLAEVCKVFPNPTAGAYYAVYATTKRGSAGYCAWHSSGTCGGKQIEFAWFFNLDGDSGCDPADATTGHSQGLAALANVTGHELSETVTDPQLNAWYDRQGSENADKCAWTFNVASVSFPNGTNWKIQGNWSNKAYTAGTGYPNSSGQRGCLDGH
ncbi:MAG: hypothetical protein U0163_03020 [Gemmatimonadaceae bacterium]